MGELENGRLVGFILNSTRDWQGKLTAYDCGTGVLPEYKKRGRVSQLPAGNRF